MQGSKFILLLFCLLFGFTTLKAQDSLGTINLVGKLYDYWGTARSIAFRDTFAFVATEGSGLRVLDVSHPNDPRELSYYYTEKLNNFSDIALVDSLGFVLTDDDLPDDSRLLTFNLSDPLHPKLLATCFIGKRPSKIKAVNGYLYVAELDSGLRVYDIINPLEPKILSQTDYADGAVSSFCVTNNLAFVSIERSGVQVLDIENPNLPVRLDTLKVVPGVSSIVNNNDTLYVAGKELQTFDISNPKNIRPICNYKPPFYVTCLSVADDAVILKLNNRQLISIDISDPANPKEIGSILGEHSSYSPRERLFYSDGFVCHLIGEKGLRIYDFNDPRNPQLIGKFDSRGPLVDIDVVGDYAYMRDRMQGLLIADVSDPTNPHEIGRLELEDKIYDGGLIVNDRYVYVINYLHGLHIINVTNPQLPQYVRLVDGFPGGIECMVHDSLLLMTSDRTFLDIFDISTPDLPVHLSSFDIGLEPYDIAAFGNYVYIVDSRDGLLIINISDPTFPRVERFYTVDGKNCFSITIDVERQIAAIRYDGDADHNTAILDLADPVHPLILSTFTTKTLVQKILGEHLLIGESFFQTYNIGDPKHPYQTGNSVSNKLYLQGFDAQGENMYALYRNQLLIYDCSSALPVLNTSVSLPADPSFNFYPNPTNGYLWIDYRLTTSGNAGLSLYDLRGRLVEEIMPSRLQSAGEHQIQWSPGELPSGQYFLKFDGNGTSSNQTITILK